jgi:F0F1-type ATP synthase membrane subunit b/b'
VSFEEESVSGYPDALSKSVEILNQLGELFLAAVPTVIIVFLFYLFLRWSFFKPMERVLSERHQRAEGARAEAESTRAAVREKLRAYADALKKARAEIFAEQEASRRRALDERQAAINAARAAAQSELQAQKKSLAAEVEAARAQLEQTSATLAGEIADVILAVGPPVTSSPGRGEAR